MNLEPISLFKRGWIASGYQNHTYGVIPYDRPLDFANPTPDFVWLDDVGSALKQSISETSTLNAEENELQAWPDISKAVRQKGLRLPAPFSLLVEKAALQRKIPTCTGCFLSLSDNLIPLPGVEGHFLLRFLNDSQSCFLWYLCLSTYREPWVIASSYFFEPDIFKAMEYEEITADDLVSNSYLCAETFLEFIFRFWLENTIWYSEHEKLELSPLQKAYQAWIG